LTFIYTCLAMISTVRPNPDCANICESAKCLFRHSDQRMIITDAGLHSRKHSAGFGFFLYCGGF
jgi:hypothetical protein